tara:strand:- start:1266 stop:1565 length:300 start_codon:yes stop_codon:yes gene_type:complete
LTDQNNKKAIDVGNLFAVIDETNKLVGVELGFNANVKNRDGAADLVTSLSSCVSSPRWVINNIMRFEADAQDKANGDEDSVDNNVDASTEGSVEKGSSE